LCCVALAMACRRDEPIAGGEPLSHWVSEAKQVSLLTFWNSRRDERRHRAFERLREIGEPAVPALVELMRGRNHTVKHDAVNALYALGPRARSAVPELEKMVRGADADIRVSAAMILGAIGSAATPAVPALMEMLRASDQKQARIAAQALATIGGDGQAALDVAVRTGDADVRQQAMSGIASRRRDAAETRRYVTEALADTLPAVRATAMEMLIMSKASDVEAMSDLLVRGLNDSSQIVAKAARRAFSATNQYRTSLPLLTAVLAADHPGARADAAWKIALTFERPRSRGALAAEDSVRMVRALEPLLDDADPRVRIYSAKALAVASTTSHALVAKKLRANLPSVPVDIQLRGAPVLWRITHEIEDVRAAYENGFADTNRSVRLEALRGVLALGAAARPLMPALEKLRDTDPDRDVRHRAKIVLEQMARRG
jgi:HEAT repeat protein